MKPDAYELTGTTEHGREVILSYEQDDAGNIEMRISKVEPLFTQSKIQREARRIANEMMEDQDLGLTEEQDDAIAEFEERLKQEVDTE